MGHRAGLAAGRNAHRFRTVHDGVVFAANQGTFEVTVDNDDSTPLGMETALVPSERQSISKDDLSCRVRKLADP